MYGHSFYEEENNVSNGIEWQKEHFGSFGIHQKWIWTQTLLFDNYVKHLPLIETEASTKIVATRNDKRYIVMFTILFNLILKH